MKLFYSAYTCKGNTGDIIINKLQIEEYARYGEVYVDCTGMPNKFYNTIFDTKNPNIKDFVKCFGLNYRGKNMLRALKIMQKENFTHFTKSPGPYSYIKLPFNTFLIRIIGAFGFWLAGMFGMKVIAMGVDLNYKQEPKWLQRLNNFYFNIYDQIGIRSYKNQQELSQNLRNVIYVPDMAFLYSVLSDSFKTSDSRRIALSFRKVENEECFIEKIKIICNFFLGKKYEIDIVYQVDEDKSFCQRIFNTLNENSIHFVDTLIDYYSLDIYTKYDFVISNRLHVLLIAAISGAVPYGLVMQSVKENKILNVFSSIFESRLVSYIEDFKEEYISDIFNKELALKNEIENCVRIQKSLCVNFISKVIRS